MARVFASFFVLPIVAAGLICAAAWGEIAPPLETVRDPGTGVIALDGPWQFHTGDDPSFAAPSLDDSTGHNGWEQIAVKSGAPDQLALLVPRVESIYEIYGTACASAAMAKCPLTRPGATMIRVLSTRTPNGKLPKTKRPGIARSRGA